jgi:hypothetical protein
MSRQQTFEIATAIAIACSVMRWLARTDSDMQMLHAMNYAVFGATTTQLVFLLFRLEEMYQQRKESKVKP